MSAFAIFYLRDVLGLLEFFLYFIILWSPVFISRLVKLYFSILASYYIVGTEYREF